ncbi:MAG: glycerate kinase [bacterium]|nr:glycerate kinase [bacterium]
MRVLIAPDKFKGTLSAAAAARAMRAGVQDALADGAKNFARGSGETKDIEFSIECKPLADGGEGSHDCLRELSESAGLDLLLRENSARLADPNGAPRAVSYLESDPTNRGERGLHCYLETALAIGLTLPGARKQSILDRTTRGVGEWMAARIADDAATDAPIALHLFLGGSGTSDGGFGLARALGFRFLRATQPNNHAAPEQASGTGVGEEIESFREVLAAQSVVAPKSISTAAATGASRAIAVHVYTDVQNPLDGPDGAARLFGPQKGANAAEVEALEERLAHMGRLFEDMRARLAEGDAARRNAGPEAASRDIAQSSEPLYRRPGAGAAGGLALPLLYWPAATIHFRSGIDFFLEAAGLDELLVKKHDERPELIISGEGATDRGSLQGKVVAGLGRCLSATQQQGGDSKSPPPPLLIVSGMIPAADRAALVAAGFPHLYDTNAACGKAWPLTPEQARDRLRKTTAFALRDYFKNHGPESARGE